MEKKWLSTLRTYFLKQIEYFLVDWRPIDDTENDIQFFFVCINEAIFIIFVDPAKQV